jgi:hypothetical protein
MNKTKIFAWSAVGIFAALISAEAALAGDYRPKSYSRGRAEIRNDWREIRRDRAELRRDIEEFHRDRAALRDAYRRGASPYEISQRRGELRRDLEEIAQDRRELRRDYAELHRDRARYGWYRHPNGSWYRSHWNRWDHDRSWWRHDD